MAIIQAEIKRGILRSIYRNSQAQSGQIVPLAAALAAYQDSGFQGLNSGRIIVSTSGFGKSTSFAAPSTSLQFTQEQVFALSEELLETYDAAIAALNAGSTPLPPEGPPGSNDAAIFSAMMLQDNMQTITSVRDDHTMLRYPTFSTGALAG